MENTYRLVISKDEWCQEIVLDRKKTKIQIGNTVECDFRLPNDLHSDPFSLSLFFDDSWTIWPSENMYLSSGGF